MHGTPAVLAEVAAHGVVREYRARTVVLSEGDRGDCLFVILQGRVRVFITGSQGREVVLAEMGTGEYFGELAYDRGPRAASVVTLEPCRLLVVEHSRFAGFVARDPALARHFITRLIRLVRDLTENVRSLALMDAYGRVARLLLERAVSKGGEQFVPGRLTHSEVAARVGCSREMVSRIFKDMVAAGTISVEAERILIRHEPAARSARTGKVPAPCAGFAAAEAGNLPSQPECGVS